MRECLAGKIGVKLRQKERFIDAICFWLVMEQVVSSEYLSSGVIRLVSLLFFLFKLRFSPDQFVIPSEM